MTLHARIAERAIEHRRSAGRFRSSRVGAYEHRWDFLVPIMDAGGRALRTESIAEAAALILAAFNLPTPETLSFARVFRAAGLPDWFLTLGARASNYEEVGKTLVAVNALAGDGAFAVEWLDRSEPT